MSLFAGLHPSQVLNDACKGPAGLGAQLADAADQCGAVGVAQLRQKLVLLSRRNRVWVVEEVGDRDPEVPGQRLDGASAGVGVAPAHQGVQRGARDLATYSGDALDDLVEVEGAGAAGWSGETIQLVSQRPRRDTSQPFERHQGTPTSARRLAISTRDVVTLAAPSHGSQPGRSATG